MKVLKKIVLGFAAPVVALGGLALAGAANAVPLASVTAINAHVDEITSISAVYGGSTAIGNSTVVGTVGTPITPSPVTFAGAGTHGPLTWHIAGESNVPPQITFSLTPAGVLSAAVTNPVTPPAATPSVLVEATDGVATGFATLSFPHFTETSNKVDTLTLALSNDVVALNAPDNSAGQVSFTTVPAGVTTLLGGSLPAGIAFSNGVLSSGSAVFGLYHHLNVSATDANGAKAVESFDAVITPAKPPAPTTPFVYAGHVLTVDAHNATVGWKDGIPDNATAWGSGMVNGHVNHCVEVFVYGFDRPAGTAHVGFTCDNGNPAANVGYLRSLAPGHTYALFVQPATGSYGSNHPIPGTNPQAHIEVITPAA